MASEQDLVAAGWSRVEGDDKSRYTLWARSQTEEVIFDREEGKVFHAETTSQEEDFYWRLEMIDLLHCLAKVTAPLMTISDKQRFNRRVAAFPYPRLEKTP